ncbi:TPA: DNA breaking-rejoining protein [Escherichia coli]|uniref:DNA breaking-rejoining protein n=1 Tax=Escherichia coli TaxID=562 RepID=UPI001B01B408|nr:DNA breaking-rejoining protein [Escherichia coli]EFN2531278.1 DNA breaking-rejoining protein [Escherichia coli]EHS6039248.1 DNA breaking-rejoining protein [Escherichia coli]EKR1239558.1 DNA breaking-rejoining protein [Escherichia coli]MCQ1715230.1 DNA breaking-rejoining protein [Escherichia coli]HBA9006183.1 DNA breaking-rejoining protein [Escherichia coli]
MEIIKSSLALNIVNDSLAEFKCGKKLRGFIQIPEKGEIAVIIDGGYILGKFDCCACAIEEISLLAYRIEEADKKYGMDYQKLKEHYGLTAIVRAIYVH